MPSLAFSTAAAESTNRFKWPLYLSSLSGVNLIYKTSLMVRSHTGQETSEAQYTMGQLLRQEDASSLVSRLFGGILVYDFGFCVHI